MSVMYNNGMNKIFAGMLLSLSGSVSLQSFANMNNDCTHQVRPGETLSLIAKNYGFTRGELLSANPIDNPNHLRIGQILNLPSEDNSCVKHLPLTSSSLPNYDTAFNANNSSNNSTPFPFSTNDFSIKDYPSFSNAENSQFNNNSNSGRRSSNNGRGSSGNGSSLYDSNNPFGNNYNNGNSNHGDDFSSPNNNTSLDSGLSNSDSRFPDSSSRNSPYNDASNGRFFNGNTPADGNASNRYANSNRRNSNSSNGSNPLNGNSLNGNSLNGRSPNGFSSGNIGLPSFSNNSPFNNNFNSNSSNSSLSGDGTPDYNFLPSNSNIISDLQRTYPSANNRTHNDGYNPFVNSNNEHSQNSQNEYMCKAAIVPDVDQLALLEKTKGDIIPDGASPALSSLSDRPYAYYASSNKLTDVLENFAGSYYIPLVLDTNLNGEVNGKIGPMTPVSFLDHMANIYGFMWYFDGHSLFIYKSNAAVQRLISLEFLTTEQFKTSIKKIGIWDGRFFWKDQPKEGVIFVSGPPRYVEMVSEMASVLDQKEGDRQKNQLTVCTFRLKYAWATDKSFKVRSENFTVPGVSTLLKNIIYGGGIATLPNDGLDSNKIKPAKNINSPNNNSQKDQKNIPLNAGTDAEQVLISADPRMNAVIIHDLTSKMPMYGELIKSLDKPSPQIEINVSIIEVSTNHIKALGIDWQSTKEHGNLTSIKFNPVNAATTPYTTILSADFNGFQANLNLLANKGKAKVMSRPSILTLDNLEAVLDNSSTFYVKVASQEDAQLFPVTSGTTVQVTPRIVRENSGRTIHMNVNIQDGSDGGENVKQSADGTVTVPKVSNSSINTQAIINENESLLVGGFYKETDSSGSNWVPGLGKIPILGRLFRSKTKKKEQVIKMFLISPRIIDSVDHRKISRLK